MNLLRLVCLGAALLCCATPVFATSSRVESMGGGDDYFEDINNVLRWYGSLASYGGTALFELGETSGSSVERRGATLIADLTRGGGWGTAGLFLFGDNPDEVIRLAWGKRFGGVQIGLQWKLRWEAYHWYDQSLGESGVLDTDDQVFGLGARWELGDRLFLDTAGDVAQTGRRVELADAIVEPNDFTLDTLSGRMRLFWGVNDRSVIVPLLGYRRDLRKERIDTYWDVFDRDRDEFILGLGGNHLPDADTMIVGSFTYGLSHEDLANPRDDSSEVDEVSTTANTYILRMGIERRLLPWLTLRAGAMQVLEHAVISTLDSGMTELVRQDDDNEHLDVSLGLALHFGPFDADFAVQDETPFYFGSIVTNAGNGSDTTWSKITLQYVF